MTKIEKIIRALDEPSRIMRARYMFELMEDERVIGVEVYKEWKLSSDVKLAIVKENKEKRKKEAEELKKGKGKKQKKPEKTKEDEDEDDLY